MLAQNFKTPANLGLTDDEHAAFVTLLGMLERGEITHRSVDSATHVWPRAGFVPGAFNMRYAAAVDACGSVGCICGWAEHVGDLESGSLMRRRMSNRELCALVDPSAILGWDAMNRITTSQTAMALRSYLSSGESHWSEVMATS